jgi:PKD repeat protein
MQHESEQENERQNEMEIEITPRSAAAGSPVAFSLKNAGSNVTGVAWTFGDGSTATGTTATHTYTSAGEFEVNAQITLTGGAIVRAREDVHITGAGGPAPTSINFTYSPSAPAVGQEVVFTASGASAGGTFNWKFPGDVRKSGNVVTFTFAAAGSYEVEVELEHAGSETLHATRIVTVGGTTGNPGGGSNTTSIDFAWSPQAPKAGQAVSFTASFDRQPPAGSVVKWRFPDNSRPEGTSASYTFAAAGTYTVRVQIEQPGQTSIEREKSLTVSP